MIKFSICLCLELNCDVSTTTTMFSRLVPTARLATSSLGQVRTFATKHKVVCALYEGGEAGKANKNILGCTQNALGLREFLKERNIEFVVTSDKDGPNSEFAKHLKDATVCISQPFWPAYITADRIATAPNLKMAITAGIGSDHVDLEAASKAGMTVAEVTGSNVVSVAEHVVMTILCLVRNFVAANNQVKAGGWDIAALANKSWDIEGKHIGTVAVGRIGLRVLQRLKPFDCKLHYTDKFRLSPEVEKELGLTYHKTAEEMVKVCDVVTINCPLHPETENMFNAKMLANMKKGAFLVNTARGKIVDKDALVKAVESGHIEGYGGDVWFPQPAPKDHPWRNMPRHALTPHISGTSLDAQARYAAGVKLLLTNFFDGKKQPQEHLILDKGKMVSPSYTPGNSTKGSL